MLRIAIALAALAGLALAPASASALEIGMGNETPALFSVPQFTELPIRKVRYVAAYDAALGDSFERQQADQFLRTANAMGYEVLVSFEHSRLRSRANRLPSTAAYLRGVRAFMARYPFVRIYSPWDEINDCSQPTCRDPKAAAGYYLAMRRACPRCTPIAGEVLDTTDPQQTVRYLRAYQQALGRVRPKLWGLHNYSDVNRFRSTGTRAVLKAVDGAVWLTETGGLYAFPPGFPPSAGRQVRAERQMLRLARLSPRIERLYIYSWTGGGSFDAGLTGANSTSLRPAYQVVRDALAG